MLEVKNVSVRFGGLNAVDGVSLSVEDHTIHAIIGPNGAGKTTLFNAISGIHVPDEGEILFGQHIEGLAADRIARKGIGRTFQNIKLFSSLSVLENVLCGCHMRAKSNVWQDLLHTKAQKLEERQLLERSQALLEKIGLGDVVNKPAGSLPYGDQRKVEIVRALVANPKLLLLDEPAAGMNPKEIEELQEYIVSLKDAGYTILIIEHHVRMIMFIADMISVLNHGKKISEGDKDKIQNDPLVIEAYLGKSYKKVGRS